MRQPKDINTLLTLAEQGDIKAMSQSGTILSQYI